MKCKIVQILRHKFFFFFFVCNKYTIQIRYEKGKGEKYGISIDIIVNVYAAGKTNDKRFSQVTSTNGRFSTNLLEI